MNRAWWSNGLMVLALGAALGACGSAEEERPDLDSIGGKADAPSWFKQVSAQWGCGDSVKGAFKGTDSAHLYTFELKQGTAYGFELSASYPAAKGAAVAIYEKSSGKRVAYDRQPGRTEARVRYTPAKSGTHLVGVYSVAWTADGAYAVRAVCQPAGFNELQSGQTDFTTLERKLQYFRRTGANPELKSAVDALAGRSGEVEEADIYKVDKGRLYLFNTYRGFMIFDISDAKQPKLVSRLPVFGYPVEMFVQNSTVYALVRDALYLTQEKGLLRFKRHNVSQLVAISIADEAQPKVLSTTDIIGELREGVSRKIGDTIYVVSYMPQYYSWGWRRDAAPEAKEQAWVYSFNVADPKNAKLVEKLQIFEGGSYSTSNGQSSESRSFGSLAITATAEGLMVVENWYKYGYVAGASYSCGTSQSLQQAVVSIIDISSPTGKIKLHTKLETYGELGDQFKQTTFVDKATGKAIYLGIFARREWSSTDCKGQSFIANNLEAWDVSVAGKPAKLATLPFGKPNETVRGSVFDSDRRVAFAITAEQIDPLYALSFADPGQLKVLSAVNGLSGDMNLFRFIADKKFILAVGRDNSATCTGFGTPSVGWTSNVAVSIVDVQDLAKIRLVQRRCVTVNDASWIGSEVNWNLDQAHKMVGMHSDGLVNLVTVPVYYSKKTASGSDGWYSQETGVGMMGWDLTKYDPTKSELDQKVLETYATVVHPQGQVRRSVVFTHQGTVARRKMLNLSNTHLALVDIEDLVKPAADAVVEVAPYRAALLRFGAYIVEQVSPGWESSGTEQRTEFRVKKVGAGLDSAPVLASFSAVGVSQALKHKDALVVLRQTEVAGTWQPGALIYDLTVPTAPKLAGSAKLPLAWLPYAWHRPDVAGYWSSDDRSVAPTDRGLVFLKNEWDDKAQADKSSLVFLDLSTLSKPAVIESPLPVVAKRAYVELLRDGSGKSFFVTYRDLLGEETVEGATFEKAKYFAQPWSFIGNAWKSSAALNVPGRPLDVWTTKFGLPLLLARDSAFELTKDSAWKESDRLNLVLRAYKAVLLDATPLTGLRVDSAIREDGRLYLVAGERRDFYPMPMMKMPYSAPGEDRLMIVDVGAATLDRLFAQEIGTESASLLAVQQGRLFLEIGGDGVLVVNATSATKPTGQQFLRTLEQPTSVELAGNIAYVPAGYYGVYQLDIAQAAQLPIE